MTYEQNVKAVLECCFSGFKEENIDRACKRICELHTNESEKLDWIPCSERLPEKSGLYLISIDDFATSAIFIGDAFMISGHIITPDAWTLLPKSYKAKSEG